MEDTIIKEAVKDGNGIVTHTWRVDNTKPRCWRQDHSYYFNRELISSVREDNI